MLIQSSGIPKVEDSVKEKMFFGNKPSGELFAILCVYFVQGIVGLARLAVSFFLKDELQLSPVEVSTMLALGTLPWILKPLFGFISDGVPIFGYRRRPYLVLSGILGIVGWLSLATIVNTTQEATIAIILCSLAIAISDLIVDSLIVERVRTESQALVGSLQSLCWAVTAIGGLIAAYFGGLLLEHFSTRTVFGITAIFPLIIASVAWLIAETPLKKNTEEINQTNSASVKEQLQLLRQSLTKKAIWLPTFFVLIWHATPNTESAFFFFVTNELHFEPEFLGKVGLITNFAALMGVWIFQRFLKNVSFRLIFGGSIVLSTILKMTTLVLVTHTNRILGIDDQWFNLGDNLIIAVMGRIAFMPVLVLGAKLCPPGIEATFFAILMSANNLGGMIGYQLGALMMHGFGVTAINFDSLWLLVLVANLSSLLPLIFITCLPPAEKQIEQKITFFQGF